MDSLTLPTKDQLKEAKINLFKILEEFNEDDLSDVENNLKFEISYDSDVEEYLSDKFK